MYCQNLFSGKNKKSILKCLLKFLPRVLRFKATFNSVYKSEKASWLKGLASKKKKMPLANFSKLSKKLNLNPDTYSCLVYPNQLWKQHVATGQLNNIVLKILKKDVHDSFRRTNKHAYI